MRGNAGPTEGLGREMSAPIPESTDMGAALRKARKAAGLSQIELAKLAGIGRHAVSYWETRATWGKCWRSRLPWAVERMRPFLPDYPTSNARARTWGLRDRQQERLDALVKRKLADHVAREEARAARRRVPCGAKTRKGHPCRLLSEPGKARCKFHGGKSTGPRTAEGKARIAEAQRRRWQEYRGGIAAQYAREDGLS